jgi:hypothetical protein
MVSFFCKTEDFKKTLDLLRGLHKRRRINAYKDTCEITLTTNNVQLAIPGAVFNFPCKSKGTAKATLPFRNLYSIVDSHGYDMLLVEFYDEALRFGSVKVAAKTVFFKDDKILRTIYLPNKYTDLDLILLKNEGYTQEELDFNNLTIAIEKAERRVYTNIRFAAKYLKTYVISTADVKYLLVTKLNLKLDLDEKDIRLLLSSDMDFF